MTDKFKTRNIESVFFSTVHHFRGKCEIVYIFLYYYYSIPSGASLKSDSIKNFNYELLDKLRNKRTKIILTIN